MDAVDALMFALVFLLTLLPLAVILPSAPPMTDDARRATSRPIGG